MKLRVSGYIPPYARKADDWEIIGFCPNCKISMMFFEVYYARSWTYGRFCPICQFEYEAHGIADGKLLEIRIFHDINRSKGDLWVK